MGRLWTTLRGTLDGVDRSPRERAATIVEYALVVALFVTVLIGALEVITNEAGDEFAESSHSIGEPAPPPVPNATSTTLQVTTTVASTTTTSTTTTTTTPLPPATISAASCSGRTCAFTVRDGPANAAYSWSTSTGLSGSGTSFSPTFPSLGFGSANYTVTVTVSPGGETITRSVSCGAFIFTVCSVG